MDIYYKKLVVATAISPIVGSILLGLGLGLNKFKDHRMNQTTACGIILLIAFVILATILCYMDFQVPNRLPKYGFVNEIHANPTSLK